MNNVFKFKNICSTKKTGGKADPKLANQILSKKLKG